MNLVVAHRTKIVILDDHQLFAEGLASMLEKEDYLHVSAVCVDTHQALNALVQHQPAIMLVDINLGGEVDGIALCKKILSISPTTKVLAVSAHDDYRNIAGMKKAGAWGYLLKNASRIEILEAIASVRLGQPYFKGYVAKILQNYQANQEADISLNPRETKILPMVMAGKTTKQIAECLGISIKTVEFYRGTLFVKFEVKNAIELINKAKSYQKLQV